MAKRVLVVDDEPGVRSLFVAQLEKKGFIVETAENDLKAMEKLAWDRGFSVIVSDVNMPGEGGRAVWRYVQQLPELKDKPFFFMSGNGSEVEALRSEMAAFENVAVFSKPVDFKRIIDLVAHSKC